ncbi:MAG: DNA polymerase III subunit chi [Ponticaulis sp.]|nr:DNA polymerase III subunit chi [Ponticaulis sp.]|tara:strand:+ start:57229 stop:57684 length:456 start_codon:yes stop_codon:yes gene_type:complete
MACEWWFYHLQQPPLAAALAPLFEKCLERGWRVLVVSDNSAELASIDADLWKWRDDSFLPHGRDGELAERQPILLSSELANPNKSRVLVLLNGKTTETSDLPFERVMVVFEDQDQAARATARQQYSQAKKNEQSVRYFQQSSGSGWTEMKS